MKIHLNCECCKQPLSCDFSYNVCCTNDACLLFDKCYSYDFIEERANSIKNNKKPQIKERLKKTHRRARKLQPSVSKRVTLTARELREIVKTLSKCERVLIQVRTLILQIDQAKERRK